MKRILVFGILFLFIASIASAQCLLTLQTEGLPGFFVGQPANFQIEAVSGTAPYKFEILEGSLPEGLILTPSGRIVGVPQEESFTTFLFRVTDAEGCTLGVTFEAYVFP